MEQKVSSLESNPMYCLNRVMGEGGDERSHKLARICGMRMLAEQLTFSEVMTEKD